MSDEADIASEREARHLAESLERQKKAAARGPELRSRGYCQNPACEDEFSRGDPRLFCNAACASEYEVMKK